MQPSLIQNLILFFETCDSFLGKKILIKEFISTNRDDFDRHFTTSSSLEFELKNFAVRTSGGRAMFLGEKQSYEIGSDLVIGFEKADNQTYAFLEKYSETVFRKSILQFL